jgi:hypothetical protein
MKVKHLLEILNSCDPEQPIVLARQKGRTNYSFISDVTDEKYVNTGCIHETLLELESRPEETNCIVLWPDG